MAVPVGHDPQRFNPLPEACDGQPSFLPFSVTVSATIPSLELFVIRFPTGKGQACQVEQAGSLEDEFGWVGVYSIQGSGTTLTHMQYSHSPHTFFRVRVVSSPPPN